VSSDAAHPTNAGVDNGAHHQKIVLFFCLYFKIRIFKLIKIKFHHHLPTSEFTYKFLTMVPPTIVTGISVILLRLAYIINRQQIKNNIIFEVPQ
jgi:hypothetical protein